MSFNDFYATSDFTILTDTTWLSNGTAIQPFYAQPITGGPVAEEPREETPLEWLKRQTEEITALAA